MHEDEWPYLIEYVGVIVGVPWMAIWLHDLLRTLTQPAVTFLSIALS